MSSLPASIIRIWSKATEKRWSHHFPHYKSMGAFCCHGQQSFDPICFKTLCSLFPLQVMLHIKFDQDWSTCLRDIQVRKCKILIIQGQVTPKWVVWSGPKSNSSELLSLWEIFRCSRAANSVVSGPIWWKFKPVRDFIYVLVTCKYKKDPIKNNREKVETSFFPL